MKINSEYTFKIPSPKMYNSVDELAKLLIEKGLITQSEFSEKLSAERAGYRAVLQRMR